MFRYVEVPLLNFTRCNWFIASAVEVGRTLGRRGDENIKWLAELIVYDLTRLAVLELIEHSLAALWDYSLRLMESFTWRWHDAKPWELLTESVARIDARTESSSTLQWSSSPNKGSKTWTYCSHIGRATWFYHFLPHHHRADRSDDELLAKAFVQLSIAIYFFHFFFIITNLHRWWFY